MNRLKQVIARQGETQRVVPGTKAFKGLVNSQFYPQPNAMTLVTATIVGGGVVEWVVGMACNTIMGKGVVLERREGSEGSEGGRSYKIELEWVLAGECKVFLYTTADKLSSQL